LRAFETFNLGYDTCVFLDADVAVFGYPDEIFDITLPAHDWIAAAHACVCNLDSDPWAPKDWHKGNCAHTVGRDPDSEPTAVNQNSRPTYHQLNSGVFLYYPSQGLWDAVLDFFNRSETIKDYQFPDQDFLIDFFHCRWRPLSWKYNALKTRRYWHPQVWSDEKVILLHYIVDKPWERRIQDDELAGHLGRDGETHRWWWSLYDEWQKIAGNDQVAELVNTKPPVTRKVPLPESPGTPADVAEYPDDEKREILR